MGNPKFWPSVLGRNLATFWAAACQWTGKLARRRSV